jgi:hypothetical protein
MLIKWSKIAWKLRHHAGYVELDDKGKAMLGVGSQAIFEAGSLFCSFYNWGWEAFLQILILFGNNIQGFCILFFC